MCVDASPMTQSMLISVVGMSSTTRTLSILMEKSRKKKKLGAMTIAKLWPARCKSIDFRDKAYWNVNDESFADTTKKRFLVEEF